MFLWSYRSTIFFTRCCDQWKNKRTCEPNLSVRFMKFWSVLFSRWALLLRIFTFSLALHLMLGHLTHSINIYCSDTDSLPPFCKNVNTWGWPRGNGHYWNWLMHMKSYVITQLHQCDLFYILCNLKCTLPENLYLLQWNYLFISGVISSISAKKHLRLVESLICYVSWKLCLNCYMTVCRESGMQDTDDL